MNRVDIDLNIYYPLEQMVNHIFYMYQDSYYHKLHNFYLYILHIHHVFLHNDYHKLIYKHHFV